MQNVNFHMSGEIFSDLRAFFCTLSRPEATCKAAMELSGLDLHVFTFYVTAPNRCTPRHIQNTQVTLTLRVLSQQNHDFKFFYLKLV